MGQRLKIIILLYCTAITVYPSIGLTDEDIWVKLKEGGFVVLMRHATVGKVGDPLVMKINDCSVQRNLSQKGRKEAKFILITPEAQLVSHRVLHTDPKANLRRKSWLRIRFSSRRGSVCHSL